MLETSRFLFNLKALLFSQWAVSETNQILADTNIDILYNFHTISNSEIVENVCGSCHYDSIFIFEFVRIFGAQDTPAEVYCKIKKII